MFKPTSNSLKLLSATFAGIALSLSAAHAQYNWTGAVSSDPTVAGNYSGTVPTFGASNSGNLTVADGNTGNSLVYSSAQGTTSFNGGSIRVGVDNNNQGTSGSELTVTGGSLTINSTDTNTLGYQGSGTINVSGGAFSVLGGNQFWFSNTFAAIANVSGGEFIVGTPFLFSRDGGAATINLSGSGVFSVTGSGGTSYNSGLGGDRTPGVATINLSGNSTFRQTMSSTFALGGNFTVSFASGSTGKLSINGFSQAQFEAFVNAGSIKVDGFAAPQGTDSFTYSSAGGIGTYQLAAVPEPSTWVMVAVGAAGLFAVKRRRQA